MNDKSLVLENSQFAIFFIGMGFIGFVNLHRLLCRSALGQIQSFFTKLVKSALAD